jgi:hypothetical protein
MAAEQACACRQPALPVDGPVAVTAHMSRVLCNRGCPLALRLNQMFFYMFSGHVGSRLVTTLLRRTVSTIAAAGQLLGASHRCHSHPPRGAPGEFFHGVSALRSHSSLPALQIPVRKLPTASLMALQLLGVVMACQPRPQSTKHFVVARGCSRPCHARLSCSDCSKQRLR